MEMIVLEQGQVIVNSAAEHARSPDGVIVCVCVDLATKHAECVTRGDHEGVPVVYLGKNEHTRNINANYPDIATVISFPEYDGYEIFAISGPYRYTLDITFVRR